MLNTPSAETKLKAFETHKNSDFTVTLNYQQRVKGKAIGRYIIGPDGDESHTKDDMADLYSQQEVKIKSARGQDFQFQEDGFTLFPALKKRQKNKNLKETLPFGNLHEVLLDKKNKDIFYHEVAEIVEDVSGAERGVFVFDHTFRTSDESLSKGLTNDLGDKSQKAAAVARVHCDYTEKGSLIRLNDLYKQGLLDDFIEKNYYSKGLKFDITPYLEGKKRFSFINVWQNADPNYPVYQKPLAVCHPRSIPWNDEENKPLIYELRYKHRTGTTYSLLNSKKQEWFYYPQMEYGECLIFSVADNKTQPFPRFVFHTSFDDPKVKYKIDVKKENIPPRSSVEVRTICFYDEDIEKEKKISLNKNKIIGKEKIKNLTFFDMKHSNNAARIRLWIELKKLYNEKESLPIDIKMLTYNDLQTDWYQSVNPLKKVPGLTIKKSDTLSNGQEHIEQHFLFESAVIMDYLDETFSKERKSLPNFKKSLSDEDKARVNLMIRMHDLYLSSPNCTQEGFSHTQGCMYLAPYPTQHTRKERCMDRPTRAAKLAEIWKILQWLESQVAKKPEEKNLTWHKTAFLGKFSHLTHADLTWFPSCIFLEYMLPRVFKGWPEVFHEQKFFPQISFWFENTILNKNPEQYPSPLSSEEIKIFRQTRQDIWDYWKEKDKEGQFDSIRDETKDPSFKWVYP